MESAHAADELDDPADQLDHEHERTGGEDRVEAADELRIAFYTVLEVDREIPIDVGKWGVDSPSM